MGTVDPPPHYQQTWKNMSTPKTYMQDQTGNKNYLQTHQGKFKGIKVRHPTSNTHRRSGDTVHRSTGELGPFI